MLVSLGLLVSCTPGSQGQGADAGRFEDAGSDAGDMPLAEQEPNDGTTLDEVNDLAVGERVFGNIALDDADIFRVPTEGGRAYRVHLEVPAGSSLVGHVTVIDSGRDEEAPGQDYVQLSRDGAQSDVNVELVAMRAGHLVIVRDARNVGGQGAGGDGHGYVLHVEEIDLSLESEALILPATVQGELAHAGAMRVYRFSAANGMDLVADLQASGDMDGRLFVVSRTSGDWIARNDNRSNSDTDPLLDAPLFGSGEMLLVVDNIAEEAADLGYSLSVSAP